MIELLLQADKAVKAGALDEAERLYWQAVEKDPRNSIAVAGLAQVALARGDHSTAHVFAEKALEVDPDNLAAKRILESALAGADSTTEGETTTAAEAIPHQGAPTEREPAPSTEGTPPPATEQPPEARPVAPTKRRGLFRRVLGRD